MQPLIVNSLCLACQHYNTQTYACDKQYPDAPEVKACGGFEKKPNITRDVKVSLTQ